MMDVKRHIDAIGWPRLIIAAFLALLFAAAPFAGLRLSTSISDTLVRVGMNGVLALAMVPMIQSGCGLNFGLPLGVIAGLLGAAISVQFEIPGMAGFLAALAISVPLGLVLGFIYAQILNRVKGEEMMIATYVGFSSVAVMCMAWLLLPFSNPVMIWGYGGTGLRTTISVENYWRHVLSDFLSIEIGGLYIPTGMFLFFALMLLLVYIFFRTKTGTAMTAVGSNPVFAAASGINIDRMRTISVMMSTALGAAGILVYQQSFGFIQLYMAPLYMAFPAVAAVLLGGASVNKASISNVVIGTFLFQGILTMTPSVINSLMQTDMSEVIRIIVSNGMILYALTRRGRAGR